MSYPGIVFLSLAALSAGVARADAVAGAAKVAQPLRASTAATPAAAPAAAPAKPPAVVQPAPKADADATCVKKQLSDILEYEHKYNEAHHTYTSSLPEAGVPKSLIDECPGWADPVARTTYGGMGFSVRSENKQTGETWSINNEKSFIQEAPARGKSAQP